MRNLNRYNNRTRFLHYIFAAYLASLVIEYPADN